MDADQVADELADGTALHEVDADPAAATRGRRQFLVGSTGSDLAPLADGIDPADAESNVENMIGTVGVPVGVAGPLPVDGAATSGARYLPLATTEGALVASVNRGCAAIRAAGGATARVTKRGMTRAPVFRTPDVAAATAVAGWVEENVGALRAAAEETTSHGELLDVEPYVVGDAVYCRFRYDTKDAMGMNMATVATRAAAARLEDETAAELVALSGNLCTDKKPAAINAVQGRGRSVVADVTLDAETVQERLGTAPAAVARVNERKNLVGSAKAGSLGFNAHAANVIAATFIATGQDPAQVVEGANAITTASVRADGSLYASCSLASLAVGTVGGGTGLPGQTAALELLGVRGGGDPSGANADALAEIVAAGVLAGELSLLAALAGRQLTDAHEELGR